MGREAATKALLDAGITYDKVQQVTSAARMIQPRGKVGSPICSSGLPPHYANSCYLLSATTRPIHPFHHRLLSDTAMVTAPVVSALCTSSECTR